MKVIYRKNELVKPLILQSIPQYQALKALIINSFKLAKKQWELKVYDQDQKQQYLVESNEDYQGNVSDYKDRQIKNPFLVYVDTQQDDSLEISYIKQANAEVDKEQSEQFNSSEQENQKQKPKEQLKIQKQQEKEIDQLQHFEQQQQRQSGQVEVYQAEQVNDEIKEEEVQQPPNQPQQDSASLSQSSDSHIEQQHNHQPINEIKKQPQIIIIPDPVVQPEPKRQQLQPPKEQAIQVKKIDKQEVQQIQNQHSQNQLQGEKQIQIIQVQREEEKQMQRDREEGQKQREQEREREMPSYLKSNNEKTKQQFCQQQKYQQNIEKVQLKASFSCSFCRQQNTNLHILCAFTDIRTCQSCQQSWLIQSKRRKVGAKGRPYFNNKNELHQNCSFCGERQDAMFKVGKFDIRTCIPCRQKWEIVPVYEYICYANQEP